MERPFSPGRALLCSKRLKEPMETPAFFRGEAASCRRSAADVAPGLERRGLVQLAAHYEREARRIELADLARRSPNVIPIDRTR